MPHQGVGFIKMKLHSNAAGGRETALNYETALLECGYGSQSASAKSTLRRKTTCARWRTASSTRTFFEYIMKPAFDSFSRAFRET